MELKKNFDLLSNAEKMEFMKEIMPDLCKVFGENPQNMMKEMMPYCKDMMKDCGMDMSMMMSMMNSGNRSNQK